MNCCGLSASDFRKIAGKLRNGARLMVGHGDYDAYVAHMRARHRSEAIMSREAFFRAREDARFGVGGSRAFRCC
jgi:uncharacterized short protein YbdD (DUF466 family)